MFLRSKIVRVAKCQFHWQIFIGTKYACFSSNNCDSGDTREDDLHTKGDAGKEPCTPSLCYSSTCDNNPSSPTVYDCRKYGHCLPSNDMCPPFDPLPNIPTGIFRCTGDEKLGAAGASKCGCYQCPEYFAYQHMTYYDLHLIMRNCRGPNPKTGRKS